MLSAAASGEYPGHAQRPVAIEPSFSGTRTLQRGAPPPNVPRWSRRGCPQRAQSGEPAQLTQPWWMAPPSSSESLHIAPQNLH